MQEYVAGFLFSEDRQHVALVRKKKPEWQAGKLNAIGGKVEPREFSSDAMVREFKEETGVHFTDWKRLTTMVGNGWIVSFFYAFSDKVFDVRTVEEEEIAVYPISTVLMREEEAIRNLRFLVALALDDSGLMKPRQLNDLT